MGGHRVRSALPVTRVRGAFLGRYGGCLSHQGCWRWGGRWCSSTTFGPERISLPEGQGTARVTVTFSQPGEYVLRVQVDVFSVRDGSSGDQCWTNRYARVSVTS